jgi:ATP adenylyltransferase
MAYVGGPKAPGCIFCNALQAEDESAHLVLARTPALVLLNKYPYANGHLMVAPLQHTADLPGMRPEDYAALMQALQQAVSHVAAAFGPQGMNVGMNLGEAAGAGVADHLHWHIVPRWVGDTNFMPLLAEARVVSEHLEATYDRLRPLFA